MEPEVTILILNHIQFFMEAYWYLTWRKTASIFTNTQLNKKPTLQVKDLQFTDSQLLREF